MNGNLFFVFTLLVFGLVVVQSSLASQNQDEVLRRGKRAMRKDSNYNMLWTTYREDENFIVPYEIDAILDANYTRELESVFDEYHRFTCVRFRQRTNERFYITIKFENKIGPDSHYCGQAFVGRASRPMVHINRGCMDSKNMLNDVLRHELFHTLGFSHEHDRFDVNDNILVPKEFSSEMGKNKHTVSSDPNTWTHFDFYSTSNYGSMRLRSSNIRIKDMKFKPILSRFDIKAINRAYRCPRRPQGSACIEPPRLIGEHGKLSSDDRRMFEHTESVHVVCEPGFEPRRFGSSRCVDGNFDPPALECVPIVCEDQMNGCELFAQENEFCKDEPYACPRSCGLCEHLCLVPPVMLGSGSFHFSKFVLFNHTVEAKCHLGYVPVTKMIATCKESGLDVTQFQCVAERAREVHDGKDCYQSHLPNVTNGALYPQKERYAVGETVQLVCDDGYETSSLTNTAVCTTFVLEREGVEDRFHHGELRCVEKQCMDANPANCSQNQSKCHHPEHYSAMKKDCEQTCGYCGKCKHSPLFDRRFSSLSSIKVDYEEGDIVRLTCMKGYRAENGVEIATCQQGQFQPANLTCVPDETGCSYEQLMSDLQGGANISFKLDNYPDQFQVDINCDTPSASGLVTTKLGAICTNGTFNLEEFTCPVPSQCELEQLVEKYSLSFFDGWFFLPHKDLYNEGNYVALSWFGLNIWFKCKHDGNFLYIDDDKVDSFCKRDMLTDEVEDKFATIIPDTKKYAPGYEVKLTCSEGVQKTFRCMDNGLFDVGEFTCPKSETSLKCKKSALTGLLGSKLCTYTPNKMLYESGNELSVRCTKGGVRQFLCDETTFVEIIAGQGSSSVEIVGGCPRSTLPNVMGNGTVLPLKNWYAPNEKVQVKCNFGHLAVPSLENSTCVNGSFDNDKLICKAIQICRDEAHDCEEVTSCSNEQERSRCELTCGLCVNTCSSSEHKEVKSGRATLPERAEEVLFNGDEIQFTCVHNNKTYTDTCYHGTYEDLFAYPAPKCPPSTDYCVDESQHCDKLSPFDCKFKTIHKTHCRKTCLNMCRD